MHEWKKSFADQMGKLRTHWEVSFEQFADETLRSVFDEFADFVSRYDFQASVPREQAGMRSFKFALGEDNYVLMTFKPAKAGEFTVESELFCPGQGRLEPIQDFVAAGVADREWVEGCFQKALDRLVARLAHRVGTGREHQEPAMA